MGTVDDLKQNGLIGDGGFGELGGIPLGMLENGRIIMWRGETPMLVSGLSEAGKSVGIIQPGIMSVDSHSIIVNDPKGENYDITARWRAKLGPTLYINFAYPDSACINPLSTIRVGTIYERNDIGNRISMLVEMSGKENEVGKHYAEMRDQLFQGIILYMIYDTPWRPRSYGEMFRLVEVFEERTLDKMLVSKNEKVEVTARNFKAKDASTRKGIVDAANKVLRVFDNPIVDAKTSSTDIDINDLMAGDKPVSLYLTCRENDKQRLNPLLIMIYRYIIDTLSGDDFVCDDGRKKVRRVYLFEEEFADAAKIFLNSRMLTMRSKGFNLVLVTQTIDDLKRVYGSLQTVDANCGAIVTFTAMGTNEQQYSSNQSGQKVRGCRARNS